MVETLSTVSVICFIASGVCLLIAIILFIVFRIPSVISDLSGRTARKSIAKYRLDNERTGTKRYRPRQTSLDKEKMADTISAASASKSSQAGQAETGYMGRAAVIAPEEETTPLQGADGTTQLQGDEAGTTPLYSSGETTPLYSYMKTAAPAGNGGRKIDMLEEVVIVHTNEIVA